MMNFSKTIIIIFSLIFISTCMVSCSEAHYPLPIDITVQGVSNNHEISDSVTESSVESNFAEFDIISTENTSDTATTETAMVGINYQVKSNFPAMIFFTPPQNSILVSPQINSQITSNNTSETKYYIRPFILYQYYNVALEADENQVLQLFFQDTGIELSNKVNNGFFEAVFSLEIIDALRNTLQTPSFFLCTEQEYMLYFANPLTSPN